MFTQPWYLVCLNLVAGALGFLRFKLPVSGGINHADIFKDIAHLFVGFCIGFGFYDEWGWWLAGGLTVLEVVAFVIRRKPSHPEDQMNG